MDFKEIDFQNSNNKNCRNFQLSPKFPILFKITVYKRNLKSFEKYKDPFEIFEYSKDDFEDNYSTIPLCILEGSISNLTNIMPKYLRVFRDRMDVIGELADFVFIGFCIYRLNCFPLLLPFLSSESNLLLDKLSGLSVSFKFNLSSATQLITCLERPKVFSVEELSFGSDLSSLRPSETLIDYWLNQFFRIKNSEYYNTIFSFSDNFRIFEF